MATRELTCFIAVCDLCGKTSDDAEGGLHAHTPEEAIENATYGTLDERGGWTIAPDGRLVCDMRKDAAHEDVHAAAGKRMSYGAMVVRWANA